MMNFLHKLITPFKRKQQQEVINRDYNEDLLNYEKIYEMNEVLESNKWINSAFNKTSSLLLLTTDTQINCFQFKNGHLKQISTFYKNKIGALHSIKNSDQFIFINLNERQISSFIGINNCKTLTINKCCQHSKFQSFILNKNEDLLIEYGQGILIFQKQNAQWKFIWYGKHYAHISRIHIEENLNILICKVDIWRDCDGVICIYQKNENENQVIWKCIQTIPIAIINSICYMDEHKIIIIAHPKRNLNFYKFNFNNNQFEIENDKVNNKIQHLTFSQHEVMIDFNGIQSTVGIEENKYFISTFFFDNPIGYFQTIYSISNYGLYIIIHNPKQSEIRQLQLG